MARHRPLAVCACSSPHRSPYPHSNVSKLAVEDAVSTCSHVDERATVTFCEHPVAKLVNTYLASILARSALKLDGERQSLNAFFMSAGLWKRPKTNSLPFHV